MLAQGKAMVKHGLVEAGYNSIILDDCFTELERDKKGRLVAGDEHILLLVLSLRLMCVDRTKWPRGLRYLTDRLRSMGISGSAYSDAGYKTCAGYPGSYGYESVDLQTWSEWGMDYLKYDNCYIPFDNVTQQNVYGRYAAMTDAIAARSAKHPDQIPFWLSLCEWGWQQPWIWGSRLGHSWRIDGDLKPWWSSITVIIDIASFQYWASDFYGHNDMDVLEIGNTGQGNPPGNLTFEEAKSHFTAWALLKSPLIISTDLTNATKETISILGNRDLIKINQDPHIGQSISPFRWGGDQPDFVSDPAYPAQYWSGNSSYGVVFMILNNQDQPADMFFNLTESWAIRAGRLYDVYDMWSHTHNGTVMRNMTLNLQAHGVAALLLNDAGPEPSGIQPYCAGWWQCTWPNGTYYSN